MRALHPGSGSRRQQITGSSTSDFYGPAMIGMSALFGIVSNEGCNGGGTAGSATDGDDGGGGGSASSARGSGSKDGGSSGSGSSSESESEVESESDEELDYHWQQEALALTSCRLWRIDCQQLYRTLRDQQPGVLLYMLRRLLQSLGVPDAATNGGGTMPAEQPPPPAPPHAGSRRMALVQRLLVLCRELEAAEREQAAAGGSHKDSQRVLPSWRADSLASTTDSLATSFGAKGSAELASVTVAGGGGHLTADVLHTGD